MAYNKFKKLEQLRTKFGLNDITENWLPDLSTHFIISQHLLDDLLGRIKCR